MTQLDYKDITRGGLVEHPDPLFRQTASKTAECTKQGKRRARAFRFRIGFELLRIVFYSLWNRFGLERVALKQSI
ncbi:hypothetical protein [Planococcus sp. ISL-110]|uniref:hypothetical protein n=1 Tax=Planococcus sp. ISL-110 TaxID=2819167 RepID=UPI001BE967F8|nr:hypothetical protein [Planococcus sp. ISL-110]MBT2571289.1 hypothetical protein [Planococcus sp. ISL-110]